MADTEKRKIDSLFSFFIPAAQSIFRFLMKILLRSEMSLFFFVIVSCKLSKRHYFSGLSLDLEAFFLNSIFYFSSGFFFFPLPGKDSK